MSSSAVKGMLTRSGTTAAAADVYDCRRRLFKGNSADNNQLIFRSFIDKHRGSLQLRSLVGQTRRHGSLVTAKSPPVRSGARAQAILTPVSDPTPVTNKRVFTFGKGRSEGHKGMKSLLGGKGANLAEMASIGLSVPPGLTISTEACQEYQQKGKKLPEGLWEEILEGLDTIQKDMGAFLGDPSLPLLLSVRSGAAISMPGMMDTVLNLGLNDEVVAGLAAKSGERFAYDSYRRFLDMFGNVVMGIPHSLFEEKLEKLKYAKGISLDTEMTASDLKELVKQYKNAYLEAKGVKFPSDPKKQLQLSVQAVFDSWDSQRAIKYRSINQITGLKGTAVNIQCMVFGNMGNTSGTGVLFTRNPSTGEKKLYGEFLVNAQGEDVVAGIRTPEDLDTMESCMPEAYKELVENCEILERHYKDMMDIEFTVQENRLWMLQCRSGKRTGQGAVKIAVDMVNEGLVDTRAAIKMVEPQHLDQLLHPQFEDPSAYKDKVVATGLPASPGAAVGQIVFRADDAEAWHAQGNSVILVRTETSPEDIGGMHAAAGILTARGGMTSHAAVVARGWGKCCVSGCSDIRVNDTEKVVVVGDRVIEEGEWLSLNGSTGEVILGKQALSPPALSGDLEIFMSRADKIRRLKVMANADTPEDALTARNNGAQGIGLCRTEHMFFASDERIKAVRKMIMAVTSEQRKMALDLLLPYQRSDFEGIFRAMDGLPVTIRLLDPPLHEFLPEGNLEQIVSELTIETGMIEDEVFSRIEKLSEVNPMLGFRGCRLGISYPELTEMQARAIFQAAISMSNQGVTVLPEIMVPLVGTPQELGHQVALIRGVAKKVFSEMGCSVSYKMGTMIEIPRAALVADEIANEAEFFSFGTNDLTQMTFGYSRDDVGKFLPIYLSKGILQSDPFEVLDQKGVGQLIKIATEKGRGTRPSLKVGICGEHGGEPSSVAFFAEVGLDYVSCSPFRVPIARLAAAQVAA
ncbi:pyruvate, phosphate dikinase, chloroplastic isoform X2 [Malania oleifera]|nr:pyruvate, phosphate dikinase, chloroplastic isoform X2 [Malania oleifera]XP_057957152.1 pyruvate, phosphate dikinase, chloroplastic isoform X2 [Malania oleifera]XP_057957153.1 pyruvate, phosphate dikinase, chloroplastic isoform X2 [Malania oleifera]XP_057957154.1 pyruvate, phosphate dikinase, chloroplastic isoform X2 [Malania oleifera]XP_057957155.1 pyruvate, phosphate dikinase, chloroplastic isoform X2 [Malania oleifera]